MSPVDEFEEPLPPVTFAPLAPAPPAAHRVWTVFVAFVASLASAAVFAALIIVGLTAVAEYRLDGALLRLRRDDVEHVASSAVGLLGGGLAACLSFALFALVPASLSSELLEARLRLSARRRWALSGIVASVGMLGIGQVCSGLLALAHLEGVGAIAQIERALWRPSLGLALCALAIVGVGAGVGEELFFRGYVQTRLAQRWGATASIAVSAALFGVAHLDPLHGAFAFLVGLFLGWVSLRSGSVRSTVIAHVVNNAASVAAMAVTDPSRRTPSIEAFARIAAGAALIVIAVAVIDRTNGDRHAVRDESD